MTKFFFGIVLVIFSLQLRAQNAEQDIQWYRKSLALFSPKTIEGKIDAANEDLRQAVDSHDLAREAAASKRLGILHLTGSNDYEKSMDYFIRSLAIEDSLELSRDKVITYLAIAQIFEETGNFRKSDELLEEGLLLNHPTGNQSIVAFILNKRGNLKAKDGQIEAAQEAYKSVLRTLENLEDAALKAETLFNLGSLYEKQNKLDLALETFKTSLAGFRSEHDAVNESRTLNEIGNLYRRMGNHEKALANHVVALEIRQRINDKPTIAESYNNIGAIYLQQKNIDRAIANIGLGLASAQAAQHQDQMKRSYDLLSMCFKEAGKFAKALEYRELFAEMSEFIQRDINQQKLMDAEMNYQLEKKETQIDRLESIRAARERELAAERRMKSFLFILIGFAAIILALIFYLYLHKRRTNLILQVAHDTVREQNLQLTDLNATKDKFFSIISHDLKGPLNSLTSFSGLLINHTDSLSKDEIRMLAKDLDKSLKNLFALLENLLEWSRSQTGNIEFKAEAFDISALLEQNKELLSAQAQNKKIEIRHQPVQGLVVHAHKHSVNTVVRNLISNAIKFTPEGGSIHLDASTSGDKLTISVSDNGVGMTSEVIEKLFRIDTKHTTKGTANEKGTGLGLILCKDFIEKNGGSIWVTSEPGKGSVFSFSLPYSPAPAAAETVSR